MCDRFWFLITLGSFFHSLFIILHSLSFLFNLSSICVVLKRLMCVKWENKDVFFFVQKNYNGFWLKVLSHLFFHVFLWFLGCKRKYLVFVWCKRVQDYYNVRVNRELVSMNNEHVNFAFVSKREYFRMFLPHQ